MFALGHISDCHVLTMPPKTSDENKQMYTIMSNNIPMFALYNILDCDVLTMSLNTRDLNKQMCTMFEHIKERSRTYFWKQKLTALFSTQIHPLWYSGYYHYQCFG